MKPIESGCLLVCAAILSACSGGGGGGSDNSNRPPTASDAFISIAEDGAGSATISVGDPDGDAVTVQILSSPTKGTVTQAGVNGATFQYSATPNLNGSDSFTYRVSDSRGASANAQVAVTIAPVADAPRVADQSFTFSEDSPGQAQIAMQDDDGDTITLEVVQAPSNGSATITQATNGSFSYTPRADYNGVDTFTVHASDGTGASATATITLAIQAVNDPALASTDVFAVSLNTTSVLDVLANDVDPDGDALTLEISEQPAGAAAEVVDGKIALTPNADALGPSRLAYRVTDPSGATSAAEVRLILGSMKPLYLLSSESGVPEIYVYNYLTRRKIETRTASGHQVTRFRTSADGSLLVYATSSPQVPFRSHVWLLDLEDPEAVPQQLPLGDDFQLSALEISADGRHVVASDQYVLSSQPNQVHRIEHFNASRPIRFNHAGTALFYQQFVSGGGRRLWRADLDPNGLGMYRQITNDYAAAEGLGMDFAITPDDRSVVSIGLLFDSFAELSQQSFISPTVPPRNDVRLHSAFTAPPDYVYLPAVTPDSRYAYYEATLGGIDGIYVTDLQSPGGSIRVDTIPQGTASARVLGLGGDGRTLFYAAFSGLFSATSPQPVYHVDIEQPGTPTAFQPSGINPPVSHVKIAPDGSALLFNSGSRFYATRWADLSSATPLFDSDSNAPTRIAFAADASSACVLSQIGTFSQVRVANPAIGGWFDTVVPAAANTTVTCAAYEGEECTF
jgi:hypothetical protein